MIRQCLCGYGKKLPDITRSSTIFSYHVNRNYQDRFYRQSTSHQQNKRRFSVLNKNELFYKKHKKEFQTISNLNIRKGHLKRIMDRSPHSIQPYLRLIRFDKPIGAYLLYSPCTWSIALASIPGCLPNMKMMLLFGLGSFIMRSAGCVINDMWDSDFDKKVSRTKERPLAANELNHRQALGYLAGLLSCGLSVLLSLNWYSVFLGASSMGLVVSYPLMKRYTYWPQLFLGMTFNWGALLGYSACAGYCSWPICLPLYVASVSWTIIYDTIYAHQDKADDSTIGVKSTALLFGEDSRYWLNGFSVVMFSGLITSGYFAEQTLPFYIAVLLSMSQVAWQVNTVNFSNESDCASKFRSNRWLGPLIFFGIVCGNFMKESV